MAASVAEVGAAGYLLGWPRCQHIHDINVRCGSRCVSINQDKRAAVAAAANSTCSRSCYHVQHSNKAYVAKTGPLKSNENTPKQYLFYLFYWRRGW